MAESLGLAAGGPTFVGSPSTVADAMERWLVEGDLDGFNILDPMPLCSYPEFVWLTQTHGHFMKQRAVLASTQQSFVFKKPERDSP